MDTFQAVPDDVDYVYPYYKCRKICTKKELLKFHLKTTQHHSYDDTVISVERDKEVCDEQDMGIEDSSCLIQGLGAFMSKTWEIL